MNEKLIFLITKNDPWLWNKFVRRYFEWHRYAERELFYTIFHFVRGLIESVGSAAPHTLHCTAQNWLVLMLFENIRWNLGTSINKGFEPFPKYTNLNFIDLVILCSTKLDYLIDRRISWRRSLKKSHKELSSKEGWSSLEESSPKNHPTNFIPWRIIPRSIISQRFIHQRIIPRESSLEESSFKESFFKESSLQKLSLEESSFKESSLENHPWRIIPGESSLEESSFKKNHLLKAHPEIIPWRIPRKVWMRV